MAFGKNETPCETLHKHLWVFSTPVQHLLIWFFLTEIWKDWTWSPVNSYAWTFLSNSRFSALESLIYCKTYTQHFTQLWPDWLFAWLGYFWHYEHQLLNTDAIKKTAELGTLSWLQILSSWALPRRQILSQSAMTVLEQTIWKSRSAMSSSGPVSVSRSVQTFHVLVWRRMQTPTYTQLSSYPCSMSIDIHSLPYDLQ